MTRHRSLLWIALLAGCGADPSTSTPDAGARDDADVPVDATVLTDAGTEATPEWLRPIAPWTGRLELPEPDARREDGSVLLHVENAPDRARVGSVVRLRFAERAAWPARVVTDVRFSDAARESAASGNVHPERLDGWRAVSALESLAGARPGDDVRVLLRGIEVLEEAGETVLEVAEDPVQIEGREVALVRFEGSVEGDPEAFRARHYDPRTGLFDGPSLVVRMTRATARAADRAPQSSVGEIERSPLQDDGWWIYGEREGDGFRARALEPRGLMRVDAPSLQAREGAVATRAFVRSENWALEPSQAGTHGVVLLEPGSLEGRSATEHAAAVATEGSRALVVHLFGGVSGQPGERVGVGPLTITTGHFSFGVATVVRDPFTGTLRWQIEYRQVYAHNGNGIVAGAISWHSYMGSLERGWMYLRPVRDALVQLDALSAQYTFGGASRAFVPLDVLADDLSAMTAHYRVGRGTGASVVTPATSCVQDSNQALFVSLMRLQSGPASDPAVAAWLAANPDADEARRFATLRTLADDVEDFLRPLGRTRSDWAARADDIGAVDACPGARLGEIACALESYNTIFPRHAYDRELETLLESGARMFVVQTNQIGGTPPAGFGPIPATSPTAR